MEKNRNNNSGLDAGVSGQTGYSPGRESGSDGRNQGPMDFGPGRGAEGGGTGSGASGSLKQPVQAAKQFVNQGKQVARDVGQEVGSQARDMAREIGQELKGTASGVIDEQRQRVTGQVGAFAHALHRVSDELRDERDGAPVARLTDVIAQKLDDAAEVLSTREPRDLIRGIENFARREPALFLGGCLLAGVLVSRFLKASSRHDEWRERLDDGGRGRDGGWDGGWERRGTDGGRPTDTMGNLGTSGPIDINPPRGPLDRSGLGGGTATPFDVKPRTPETPPELGGGV